TSSLELAYHLIGLKEGDEAIVPVLNCTAGQMGLLRRGVKIVFADIEKETLNMDPRDMENKISGKTRAIVVVHLGGIEANPEILEIAKRHNIPVIVDAAQHHEPKELDGDYICYSFQAIKHITTADGGMLCLKEKGVYDRAKLLRWFGIDRELKERKNYQAWERREMTFDIEEAGFKYQPTDIDACFGLAALPDLERVIEYRKMLVEIYEKKLLGIKGVDIIAGGSCWLMGILVEERDELAEFLKESGVENNLVHLRNDIFRVFGGQRENLPNMNEIEPRYLYLPLNPKVTPGDVDYICMKIREFYGSKDIRDEIKRLEGKIDELKEEMKKRGAVQDSSTEPITGVLRSFS
ncbi:MAG: aminotransferase class V-fold PLP-dependent enzyme, partial [Nanoarchaeota archaeon]|nr:aminotransferase class V-fold PLP-dependent enzyme [Nanoarchaeota archaeon]